MQLLGRPFFLAATRRERFSKEDAPPFRICFAKEDWCPCLEPNQDQRVGPWRNPNNHRLLQQARRTAFSITRWRPGFLRRLTFQRRGWRCHFFPCRHGICGYRRARACCDGQSRRQHAIKDSSGLHGSTRLTKRAKTVEPLGVNAARKSPGASRYSVVSNDWLTFPPSASSLLLGLSIATTTSQWLRN